MKFGSDGETEMKYLDLRDLVFGFYNWGVVKCL